METNKKKTISRVMVKVIVVNILNILILAGTFVLLKSLPPQAEQVKKVNSEAQSSNHEVDSAVIKAEMEKSKNKTDLVTNLFMGDKTVIAFVSSMDELKKQGVITEYEFPVTSEISDKFGFKGLPVLVTLKGSKKDISDNLILVSKLKVLLRPITLTLTSDEAGIYNAKFGGFVYTQ